MKLKKKKKKNWQYSDKGLNGKEEAYRETKITANYEAFLKTAALGMGLFSLEKLLKSILFLKILLKMHCICAGNEFLCGCI